MAVPLPDLTTVKDTLTLITEGLSLIKTVRKIGGLKKYLINAGVGKDKLEEIEKKIEKALRSFPEIEKAINFYIDLIPEVAIAYSFADKVHEIALVTSDINEKNIVLLSSLVSNITATKSKLIPLKLTNTQLLADKDTAELVKHHIESIQSNLDKLNGAITNMNIVQVKTYSKELSDVLSDFKAHLISNAKEFSSTFKAILISED